MSIPSDFPALVLIAAIAMAATTTYACALIVASQIARVPRSLPIPTYLTLTAVLFGVWVMVR